MTLKTWLIGLSLVFLSASQAVLQDEPTWTLTSAQPLSELVGEEYDIGLPVLSPDGSAVSWWDRSLEQVCAYFFEDEQTTCYETPDTLQWLGRYSYPTWSPDSRFLAFSETFYDMLHESDIWVLDVERGVIEDKTDDQILEGGLELDDETPIDYLPTWNPADSTLYFFRSMRLEEGWTMALYRLVEDDEPELIVDLTQDLPSLSVSQRAAISPDGTRMALSVFSLQAGDARNGVYLIDLADGALTKVVDLAAMHVGLPEWVNDGEVGFFAPDMVAWVGNEALIVGAMNRDYEPVPNEHTVYIDLIDSTVMPLVDLSAFEKRTDFLKTSGPLATLVRVGVVAPTGDTYLGLRYGLNVEDATIAAIALPPDPALEAITVGEIPAFKIIQGTNRNTFVSQDGKALLYGWVLTFTQE